MKTLLSVLFVAALFVLLMTFSGCGYQPPPTHFSIDSEFSEPERETIRAAVDSWCEAVGWCPEEGIWVDRGRISLVPDLKEDSEAAHNCPEGFECRVNGKHDGDNIRIAANRVNPEDMDFFWKVVAHEMGHYCMEHTHGGLMNPSTEKDQPSVIDQQAINGWNKGCN